MRKWSVKLLSALMLLALMACGSQAPVAEEVTIIPRPAKMEVGEHVYTLEPSPAIGVGADPDAKQAGAFLAAHMDAALGGKARVGEKGAITLSIDKAAAMPKEGYTLKVDAEGIQITASDKQGLFWGVQTLRQLTPLRSEPAPRQLKALQLQDAPVLSWRGMMMDVGRHFMPKEVVMKYIDMLSYYKMNTFHWHLTEDQGWRIEIKKYPKLTQVGAWREGKDGKPYGGFYTQEDIKEVVAYAQERHVNIVPEIEFPGHSVAAMAAYPELSCTGGPFEVQTAYGVHREVYCAGNDKSFEFIEGVLEEVVALFPGKYVHVGADECPKFRWERCPKCQARMKQEGIKDEHALQTYFINRVSESLAKQGKQIIGWDEILEGGLPKDATVQYWRDGDHPNLVRDMANQQTPIIASPGNCAYFDSPPARLTLERVYAYNPVPEGIKPGNEQYMLGGECTLWTEWMPDENKLDYMTFPRLLAFSETHWSSADGKDYADFHKRVEAHYPVLDLMKIAVGPEGQDIARKVLFDSAAQQLQVQVQQLSDSLEVRYTLDGTDPVYGSEPYEGPVVLQAPADLRLRAFRKQRPYGEVYRVKSADHKARMAKVTYHQPLSKAYPGRSAQVLVDGGIGGDMYNDGEWQGFRDNDMDLTLEMPQAEKISSVNLSALEANMFWIFLPQQVEVSISEDGKTFNKVGTIDRGRDFSGLIRKHDFKVEFPEAQAKYVRVTAKPFGPCPESHSGYGHKGWLFVDEITVL